MAKKISAEDYGERIRSNLCYLRALRGYNQKDLGERSGFAQSYISELLNGRKVVREIGTLVCLANALEISPAMLMDCDLRADALKHLEDLEGLR